jgi:hypothetical protein
LLYLSSLYDGYGVIIYQNVDSRPQYHIIFNIVTVITSGFKNSAGFQKQKKHNLKTQCLITLFLLQSFDLYFWILQFNIYCFGTLWISNPNPTAIGSCAYYFDNKASYPSITGLAAYIGLSINPNRY